jgi:hypothetical protein
MVFWINSTLYDPNEIAKNGNFTDTLHWLERAAVGG